MFAEAVLATEAECCYAGWLRRLRTDISGELYGRATFPDDDGDAATLVRLMIGPVGFTLLIVLGVLYVGVKRRVWKKKTTEGKIAPDDEGGQEPRLSRRSLRTSVDSVQGMARSLRGSIRSPVRDKASMPGHAGPPGEPPIPPFDADEPDPGEGEPEPGEGDPGEGEPGEGEPAEALEDNAKPTKRGRFSGLRWPKRGSKYESG